MSASLGRTGLIVSRLGLGAGPIGALAVSDGDAEAVLRAAIDCGMRVFDTAPSYGASEERIGRLFARSPHLREEVVLVTKGGYGVPGIADWTPEALTRGAALALGRLHTDRLDVFLLHSCPPRDDLLDTLARLKEAGLVRAVGYSGDGDGLAWAARTEAFDVLECSVNLVDQRALERDVPLAVASGKGILAKRSLANAAWDRDDHPYSARLRTAYPRPPEVPWAELAIRFAAYADGVSCALVGTKNVERVRDAARLSEKGPLDRPREQEVRRAFAEHGASWDGVV